MTDQDKASKRASDIRYLRDDAAGETFIVCKHCGQGFRHACKSVAAGSLAAAPARK